MKVCITEKPSVARDIAQILGAKVKHDGYFEGNDYCVTWTFGHLCTLKEPADYTDMWKRWSLSSLPMIPQRFGIKLIDQESIKRQFKVIESLITKADEVINCGDAGQEGELIQRWVMQKARTGCKVMRLWISSLTDDAIREGFSKLKPQTDFDNLYYAGLSRAVGDWILGMNATRLYTLKYSEPGKVLSIGRVQTPTLAIVVNRQLEIDNFKPEDYWEIKTEYRETTFSALSGRFKSEEEANTAIEKITSAPLTITDVQEKKGRESAPRLFDLTSLQVECNKRWGWSAEESLRLIQSLYEKKVTTYPRVDTTYLSEDIYPKIPTILRQMTPYAALTAPVLAAKIPKSKKVFDNSKVTDHHAIIPTGQAPNMLDGNEKKMYHLIARRFIAVFYPDCIFSTTTVLADIAGLGFKATGKVILTPGWRSIYQKDAPGEGDRDEADAILPVFTVGESGPHKPSLAKKQTQPPKFFTEGTLLRAMESAGKLVEDEELREAMKENGIGRPSTRANIIETLFRRGYMMRSGKSIRATEAGIQLIATIHEELLKSAKLTGLWENKLRRIERGDYSAKEFVDELKVLINEI
ncbi:MAG: DNA topoisomerase 3, partial [Paramuribaculum sp.]|nr:DNA topoisomerase 3 [Paramuribaculum sp.]